MTTPPPRTSPLPPDAIALLARLDKLSVEHVLVGELAAAVHGVRFMDDTVTIVPARYARNLDRLAQGLRELRAVPQADDGSTASGWTATPEALRSKGRLVLATSLCPLEVDFEPPATAGHLDLFENARRHTITPGLEVQVAALEDLIRIAEMRSGPADRAILPGLHDASRPAPLSNA